MTPAESGELFEVSRGQNSRGSHVSDDASNQPPESLSIHQKIVRDLHQIATLEQPGERIGRELETPSSRFDRGGVDSTLGQPRDKSLQGDSIRGAGARVVGGEGQSMAPQFDAFSLQEAHEMEQLANKIDVESVKKLFSELDSNKDGQIDDRDALMLLLLWR